MKINHCLTDMELNLYCSDDLSPDEQMVAEAHLANCPVCRAEVTSIKRTLAALPRHEVNFSPAEKNRFSAQVVQAARRQAPFINLRHGITAITAVAAGLLTFMMFNPGQQPVTMQANTPEMAEFDLVENLEFLEDLDLLEMMELLEQLEDQG